MEILQSVGSRPKRKCPDCGGKLTKVVSAPAFQFKGTGWYVTDYADKKKGKEADGSSTESSKKEDSSSSKESSGDKSSEGGSGESKSSTTKSSDKKSSKDKGKKSSD